MAQPVVLVIEMLKSKGSVRIFSGIRAWPVSPIVVVGSAATGSIHVALRVNPVRSSNPRLTDDPGFSPMEKLRYVTCLAGTRDTATSKPSNWMEVKASEIGLGRKALNVVPLGRSASPSVHAASVSIVGAYVGSGVPDTERAVAFSVNPTRNSRSEVTAFTPMTTY